MSNQLPHHINNRHKDALRSYYTDDEYLVDYMVNLLEIQDGDTCLEPCAGSGFFIDGLLRTKKNIAISAFDINEDAIATIKSKYFQCPNIQIFHKDFLEYASTPIFCNNFSKLIANPPYGGWHSQEKRGVLKKIYPIAYVKESYAVFLAASLQRLDHNGRAVFIIPDTFLYLHMHKKLRMHLISNFSIRSIDIFPSNIFPKVNFGYAKLCIICVENKKALENKVKIRTSTTKNEFYDVSHCGTYIEQNKFLDDQEYFSCLTTSPQIVISENTLGDYAKCVTGIYTGNDLKFIRRTETNNKGKRYDLVPVEKIAENFTANLSGITENKHFIPLLKGGGVKYFKPVQWYIDWSTEAVNFYRSNKKARFQNKEYYFKRGIGYPMVSSNKANASILQNNWMFDQSIVGIFPFNSDHFGFIFSLMNSSVVPKLLLSINPSANNSAKYIRRIPVILPDKNALVWFNDITNEYLDKIQTQGPDILLESRIDRAISEIYGLHKS